MRRLLTILLCFLPAWASAETVCLPAPHVRVENADEGYLASLVADLRPTLAHIPALTAALEDLAPDLCLDEAMGGAEGYFDPATMRIVLARGHPRELHQAILLHELRHLEQFARGFCPSDELTQSEYARAVFAVEADASAISLLLAWQRLLDGDPGVWEAMINWPSQTDIAIVLAREYFYSADPEAMAAAAFAQWYEGDERRERYYVASCSAYLDRQDIANALPAIGRLADGFLDRLCLLPDGSRYPCAERDGGRR
jgi:hypothetical protein